MKERKKERKNRERKKERKKKQKNKRNEKIRYSMSKSTQSQQFHSHIQYCYSNLVNNPCSPQYPWDSCSANGQTILLYSLLGGGWRRFPCPPPPSPCHLPPSPSLPLFLPALPVPSPPCLSQRETRDLMSRRQCTQH